jgi:carboxymethylenebutenolidase
MAMRDYLVGEVAEDYTDGLLSRREALRRLVLLGLGAGAAGSLLAACGEPAPPPAPPPAPAAPPGPPPGGGPGVARGTEIRFAGPAGELIGSWAAPAGPAKGAVLVIHENRGLTPHFQDLVGRFAGVGYGALCVDLLSAQGGTAGLADPAQAPTALAAAPVPALVADLRAGLDELGRRVPGVKFGAVGFCFGGGLVWQLLQAGETRLAAAVPFYGPSPESPDFSRSNAAVLAIYGEKDTRVDATRDRAEAALRGRTARFVTFPGADHAFFNDTGPRYDPRAAAEAWQLTTQWLGSYV